jgi:hypothetical protein
MAEFDIKNYEGKVYLKEDVLKVLNSRDLKAIANAETVLMFPAGTPLEAVADSLSIISQDIALRIKKLAREKNQTLLIES